MIAPFEADFQLAMLHAEGITDFTMSKDQDMVIFGINRIVKLTKDSKSTGNAIFFRLNGGLSIAESQKASDLEKLLAPLSKAHRMRTLRALAVAAGCDYFHIDGTGVAKAVDALIACRVILSSSAATQDAVVEAVIRALFTLPGVAASSQYSLEDAIKGAQLAANAFLHAPAFSVKQQKVVLLSGEQFSELPAALREYLGFDIDAINACNPVGRALGIVGGHEWKLKFSGHAYANNPVPSMVPGAQASNVYPVDRCVQLKLEAFLSHRQIPHNGRVDELRSRVASCIQHEMDAIEEAPSIITPGTSLFAIRVAAGAKPTDMPQLDTTLRFPARPVGASEGPSPAGFVYRNYSATPDAFASLPCVTDEFMFRHFDTPGRVLDPVMKPLKKGDAVARWLSLEMVGHLEWAHKPSGGQHWVRMPVPSSMASAGKIVECLLTAAKPTNLPSSDIPSSMSAEPRFIKIERAVCLNCVAGNWGACWHIACLLFVLRYIVRGDLDSASPTSKLCRWIMPSAKWMLEESRQIPFSHMLRVDMAARALSEAPRTLWFTDPRLIDIGGRSAIALPPRERAAVRNSPSKVAARAVLFGVAREHLGEPCAAEWGWDTPEDEIRAFREECLEKRRKRRTAMFAGTVDAGIPTIAPVVRAAVDAPIDNVALLANAAKFSSMGGNELRDECNVYAQKHPKTRMPALAGGICNASDDYAKRYMCPWHGPLVDRFHNAKGPGAGRSHFGADGVCRKVLRLSDGDAMTYWLKRWKLPGPGQTYYDANPDAVEAAGKRKRD